MFFLEAIALGFFMYCIYILFFEKKKDDSKHGDQLSEYNITSNDSHKKNELANCMKYMDELKNRTKQD